MKVHIGKKIKEAVDRSGMTVTEFADKINYSRRNVYSIFVKESVDTALLFKISQVLGQDFFAFFSARKYNLPNESIRTEEAPLGNEYYAARIRELMKEVEYLKEINMLLRNRKKRKKKQ